MDSLKRAINFVIGKPRGLTGFLALLCLPLLLAGCLRTVQPEPDVMIVLPSSNASTVSTWTAGGYGYGHRAYGRTNPICACYRGVPGAVCHPSFFSPAGQQLDYPWFSYNPVRTDEVQQVTVRSGTVGAVEVDDTKAQKSKGLDDLSRNQRAQLERDLRLLAQEQLEAGRNPSSGGSAFERRYVGAPLRPVETLDVVIKVRGNEAEMPGVVREVPVTIVAQNGRPAFASLSRELDNVDFERYASHHAGNRGRSAGPSRRDYGSASGSSSGYTSASSGSRATSQQSSRSTPARSNTPRASSSVHGSVSDIER